MQHTNKTAEKTALRQAQEPANTQTRTLVIFRDCHSKHNIVVTANSDREEERVRLRAMSKGFLVALRKPRQLEPSPATNHVWRKHSTIEQRPRPRLGGAFNLALTSLSKGGCLS